MPKAFLLEFRRDVVSVARKGEASIASVAKDFGVSESCLQRWLRMADVDDGVRPGTTSSEAAELRERNRLLEQETRSSAGRRRSSPERSPRMSYPLVLDLAADKSPVAVTCAPKLAPGAPLAPSTAARGPGHAGRAVPAARQQH